MRDRRAKQIITIIVCISLVVTVFVLKQLGKKEPKPEKDNQVQITQPEESVNATIQDLQVVSHAAADVGYDLEDFMNPETVLSETDDSLYDENASDLYDQIDLCPLWWARETIFNPLKQGSARKIRVALVEYLKLQGVDVDSENSEVGQLIALTDTWQMDEETCTFTIDIGNYTCEVNFNIETEACIFSNYKEKE